jgi:hypothetical protein
MVRPHPTFSLHQLISVAPTIQAPIISLTTHRSCHHTRRLKHNIRQFLCLATAFNPHHMTAIFDHFRKNPTTPTPCAWTGEFVTAYTVVVNDPFACSNAAGLGCYLAVGILLAFSCNVGLIREVIVDLQCVDASK